MPPRFRVKVIGEIRRRVGKMQVKCVTLIIFTNYQEIRFIIIKLQPVFGNPMECIDERICLPKLFKILLGEIG